MIDKDLQQAIEVSVQVHYLANESSTEEERYAFAYTITVSNHGVVPSQLLNRHWVITDGEERTREVHGEGVVGEQPSIAPGQEYQYSSGAVLETEVGTMHGSYQMLAEDGTCFDADIPAFTLAVPRALH